jgi:hypothetical protein
MKDYISFGISIAIAKIYTAHIKPNYFIGFQKTQKYIADCTSTDIVDSLRCGGTSQPTVQVLNMCEKGALTMLATSLSVPPTIPDR